jgi:hypothetical protein
MTHLFLKESEKVKTLGEESEHHALLLVSSHQRLPTSSCNLLSWSGYRRRLFVTACHPLGGPILTES